MTKIDPVAGKLSAVLGVVFLALGTTPAATMQSLDVSLSWGHRSPAARAFHIQCLGQDVTIDGYAAHDMEAGDTYERQAWSTTAGAGDVDGVTVNVSWPKPVRPPLKPHSIWQYLLDNGTPGQVARLKDDPGLQPDTPVLTVQMAPDGTQGFSLGLEQLARHRAMWLPEHDVFVTVADESAGFATHLASLRGERVLDRIKREPEATRAEWTDKWADFGNPSQPHHGHETNWLGAKGHLTGFVARHGSVYKFGVDRWGSLRPDLACVHKFRFDLLWPQCRWMGQRIVNGSPVIITDLERDGQRFELEQFAAPLGATAPAKRGEIASVFFTKVRIKGTGPLRLGFRLATENKERHPELRELAGRWCVVDRETDSVWLMIEPDADLTVQARASVAGDDPHLDFDCVGQLAEGQSRDIVLKLTAPVLAADSASQLAVLDFAHARTSIAQYWEDWLAPGVRFEVPEKTVNDLFRANLWHALVLPRHRTDENGVDRIDLPYSNFAYGQYNADWPINQAVYVDYMIHGLRGYFAVAEEEFTAMYHSQQQADGRVGGYANWGVYSPSMLYSIGRNFLLSGDRASFERLLPASLRALDWCLKEVDESQQDEEAPGLIVAPLNDLTHDERAWAFPNGYFVAGLDIFGRALATCGHPRAAEVQAVAEKMRADVTAAFARASVKSPVVQLADGTWNNYVPCDAMTPRRLLDVWYPTDVDCGPLHMARLAAIDPSGWLAAAMLHDHEDNLFLNQWGMANEPVYNQQVTVYLLRDEPKAAIRAFYSMMACAFSHHQLTPLEHRWAWGQYYMPASTDGAWFELYRNMLIRECDDDSLLLLQATPRKWLEQDKTITVERAPTYYGPLSMTVESQVTANKIHAEIQAPNRKRPKALLVRFRHPTGRSMKSVIVNGEDWTDFNVEKEWVRISDPSQKRYVITASY